MLSSLIDPVLSAVNQLAADNFTAYVLAFYPNQLTLRGILAALAIPTTDYGAYEAFHGEVYHVSKVASGTGAITMCTILVAKYQVFLGPGAASTLKKICNDIYGIIVP